MTKGKLKSALERMREAAGDQTVHEPMPDFEPELLADADQIDHEMKRLAVEGAGEFSEATGKLKISKIEKGSLVRMARRGFFRPDEPMEFAACELLVTYGFATRQNGEYRVTPAGRAAARQSKFSARFGQ